MKHYCFTFYRQFRKICQVLLLTGIITILFSIQNRIYAQSDTLRINEFMALNTTTLTDGDGDYSDWIELYNPTSSDIDLYNWSLSDEITNPQKWVFPRDTIKANSYLVLFASGKDRTTAGQELHTNFRLAREGEYLAFFDSEGNAVTLFSPSYPEQQADVSYAYHEGGFIPSTIPTPGEENQFSTDQPLPEPDFSHQRGFYQDPFEVLITSEIAGTDIYYTKDGSKPAENNGFLYTLPILIDTITVLRAATIKTGFQPSRITTHSYFFIDDIIYQPNNPEGYPAKWGPYTAIEDTAIADYEMDPEITQDPEYVDLLDDALLSLPTISIVTAKEHLFSKSTHPDTGGIYIYTGAPEDGEVPGIGDGWERPASVEFFVPDGSREFQINCGIQLQGGHSRRAEKSPKHSFRLVFKSQYGPTKLNFPLFGDGAVTRFNTITLRAGFGNTWHHWRQSERLLAQYGRDVWAKDTQLAMKQLAGHGCYVHLYINGLYWGLYNPTERIDAEFAESYLGGNAEDFDVIKDYASVVDGDGTAWNEMMDMANAGLASTENYQRIQGNNPDGTPNPEYEPYLDVVNLIDYMIVHFYGGNWDWDHHNWVAVRNRVNPGKGFRFISWDSEHILEDVSYNNLDENNDNCPSRVFQKLRANANFRRLFADRVQLHCYNGGILTPDSALQRWMRRAQEIEMAIIAESARWGDYRRDVHPYTSPGDLFTKDHWLTQQSFLVNQYFPNRTNTFITLLRQANLFPSINAPVFRINGQPVISNKIVYGDILTMTATTGTIYYTMDGSDPFTSPNAVTYNGAIMLTGSTHIKARANSGSIWSALNDVFFILPSDLYNLKVTEIQYHPLAQDTLDDRYFEFIELKNTGLFQLDLTGVQFVQGISFLFPEGTVIDPGGFIVLASDEVQFRNRYGFNPFGQYEGFLDNGGENIVLCDFEGDTLYAVRYNDQVPWPLSADGEGYSLVPKEINPVGDPDDPANWRASIHIHGSPGLDDTEANLIDKNLSVKIPQVYQLEQNYPNPFNHTTRINYALPHKANVQLTIFDINGRRVKTFHVRNQPAGYHNFTWNGTNEMNRSVASGIYFYTLMANSGQEDFIKTRKLLLIK
jgi:hypothetical protein